MQTCIFINIGACVNVGFISQTSVNVDFSPQEVKNVRKHASTCIINMYACICTADKYTHHMHRASVCTHHMHTSHALRICTCVQNTHEDTHAFKHTYIQTQHTHTHTHTHGSCIQHQSPLRGVYIYVYMYVYIYVCIYICVYVCMYVYVCVCIYIYMRICMNTHRHTHCTDTCT